MNLLKSMFISNYMMFAMGLMGYAGWMLYHGGNVMAWSGVLLTSAPIMMVISRLMMFKGVARTSAHFPLITLMALIGAAMSGWAWYSQTTGILAPALAAGGLVGFLMYNFWYSSFGRSSSNKLKVGMTLPAFTLRDAYDRKVTAEQLTDKPTIMIFYRGNWCPLCMAQVKELAKRYREISSLGVRVALISPQPHKNTVGLAKKFDVKFHFLTDTGNKAARALGIAVPNGLPMGMNMMGYDTETVLPTVVITNGQGQVVWTHETDNYRVRPEPDVYLDVLRQNGLTA